MEMSIFNMRDPPSSEMDCAESRSGPGSWISRTAWIWSFVVRGGCQPTQPRSIRYPPRVMAGILSHPVSHANRMWENSEDRNLDPSAIPPQNQIKTRLSLRSASLVGDIAPRVGQTMSHPSGEKRTSGTQEARSGECCGGCQLTDRVQLEGESHLTVPSLGAYALRASAPGFAGLERSTSNGDRTERANRGASSSRERPATPVPLTHLKPLATTIQEHRKIQLIGRKKHQFPPRGPLPPTTISGRVVEEHRWEAKTYVGEDDEI
ncbi:hypothetical protein DFH07DRAFT_764583 [Mycena maculata]|uniref:Uncharacterized protein n=1 Tax=Mycena maculata TaxID=230809 RepID=A0AAD7KDB6_9AGAR|nr:hypothetical protein DFH07DRAFT_764583 [Mycena maculata]